MPILFNSLLREAAFQLNEVRLVRHKDQNSARGRTPYELWRDNRPQFEFYQSTQRVENGTKFAAKYWASFLGTPNDETLFIGVYQVGKHKLLDRDTPTPHRDGVDKAGSCNVYELELDSRLGDLVGKLYIDWGPGKRSWIQRAERQDKPITEIRAQFEEPAFPGFLAFLKQLSELATLPGTWVSALRSSRGVYVLTCPRTKEQYIGSATGADGFWGRWLQYVDTGHGGNIVLKSRNPSDYQVSILEVAGSADTNDEIVAMETLWKKKLQSREMGLNRN